MTEDCGPCQSRRRRRRNPGQETDTVVVPFGGEIPDSSVDDDSIPFIASRGWMVDTNGEAPRAGDEWGS